MLDRVGQSEDLLDALPLVFPPRLQLGQVGAGFVERLVNLGHPLGMLAAGGLLPVEDVSLELEVVDRAAAVLDRSGDRIATDGHAGAGDIQQADRLIRELPGRQVSAREPDGARDGLVEDAHTVVLLQSRGESAHHPDRSVFVGFLDLDDLEPPCQRGVLLEVFLVLGPGRCGDRAQLAPGQGRLEQVGGIALAGRAAGPDHRMGLVDEQDDRDGGRLDLGNHVLEPVLELPLDASAGLEQAEVERAEHDVLEHLGHVALSDPQRQALDDGRLADARLAGEDRVVLPASDQDIQHLADLGLAADHGVELAPPGPLGEVDRVLVQGRRPGHGGRANGRAGPIDGGCDRGLLVLDRAGHQRQQVGLEHIDLDLAQLARGLARQPPQTLVIQQGQEQHARADLRRLELDRRHHPRRPDQLVELQRQCRGPLVAGAEPIHHPGQVAQHFGRVDLEFLEDPDQVGVRRLDQLREPVFDLHARVGPRDAEPRGRLERIEARRVQRLDQGSGVNAHGDPFR